MAKKLLLNGALMLYGDVGDPFQWGDGFSASDVAEALAEHGDGDLTTRINSGGGIANEGMAIYSLLKGHPGKVTIAVDGVAASAASLIAMAGDEIEMRDGAMMMIHDPSGITLGTEAAHRNAADKLAKISDNYASIYAKRSGKEQAAARAIMKAETWLVADEAIAQGFATKKIDEPALEKASFDYRIYAKAPRSLPVRMRNIPQPAAAAALPEIPKMERADPGQAQAAKPWAADFYASAENAGLELKVINDIVAKAASLENAKSGLIDAMASAHNRGKPGVSPNLSMFNDTTLDNPTFAGSAAAGALCLKGGLPEKNLEDLGPAVRSAAREMAGLSMVEIFDKCAAASGIRMSGSITRRAQFHLSNWGRPYSPVTMAAGGLSTSDLPNITGNFLNKLLFASYVPAQSQIRVISVQRPASNFHDISALRVGEPPILEEVIEGDEIKYGKLSDAKESYVVKAYAKKLAITLQVLVNDDTGAIADTARIIGRGAAQTENDAFAALLTANSGNGVNMSDGNPLYHSAHANKAGSGAALDIDPLDAARQAMRQQTGIDGKTLIDVPPRYLLVGAALEGKAEQVISSYYPAKLADINPFAQKLSPLVDPRLSGNAWRLFADPVVVPCIAHSYLNDVAGPSVESKQGWDILGIEFRVVDLFGCGVIDFRGSYLNPGA